MNEAGRRAAIGAAVACTVIGMGLSIAAILTPSWQVVNLREYGAVHEHGLWLDCIRHTGGPGGGNVAILRRYSTISEPIHCLYKFDYDQYSGTMSIGDDNSPVGEVNRHKWYGWHIATLSLLFIALITSFVAACMGTCGCCYPGLSLIFTVLTLMTTFLSSVSIGLFFFFSHRADNRFIKGIVGTYEQRVGLAFFLEMAACFFHFIAFLISMLATYLAFSSKDVALERYSLRSGTSKTNITNVARQGAYPTGSISHITNGGVEALPLLQTLPPVPPPSFHSSTPQNAAINAVLEDIEAFQTRNSYQSQDFINQPLPPLPGSLQQQYVHRHRSGKRGGMIESDFNQAVADARSMPNLGGGSGFNSSSSDVMSGAVSLRVRQKSETCV